MFDKATDKLKGKIRYRHAYVDFSNLKLSIPQEGGGNKVVETCPAAMGFAFAAGTTDGPGAFDFKQGDDHVKFLCRIMFDQSLYKSFLSGQNTLIIPDL